MDTNEDYVAARLAAMDRAGEVAENPVPASPPLAGAPDLQRLKQYLERTSQETGYGFARPPNPHDFHPDHESCAPDEIAAHKAACEAYDKGEYTPERGSEWVGRMHILRAPWGIGSYVMHDPEAVELIAQIDAALVATPAAPLPQPQADADYRAVLINVQKALLFYCNDGTINDTLWMPVEISMNETLLDYIEGALEGGGDPGEQLTLPEVALPHQGEGSIDSERFRELLKRVCSSYGMLDVFEIEVAELVAYVGYWHRARLARTAAPSEHPDDLAVDRFSAAMKARMAQKRVEGRGGWDSPDVCSIDSLKGQLGRVHYSRPVDIGNYAMMLWNRAQPVIANGAAQRAPYFEEQPDGTITPVDPADYAAPAPLEAQPIPRVLGVSRDAESPGQKGVLVSFERPLTDDELRAFHDGLAGRVQAALPIPTDLSKPTAAQLATISGAAAAFERFGRADIAGELRDASAALAAKGGAA